MLSVNESKGQLTGSVIGDKSAPYYDYSRYHDYYQHNVVARPHSLSPYYFVVYFRDPSKEKATASRCQITYSISGQRYQQTLACHFKATLHGADHGHRQGHGSAVEVSPAR